jgi:hypothetical protein
MEDNINMEIRVEDRKWMKMVRDNIQCQALVLAVLNLVYC